LLQCQARTGALRDRALALVAQCVGGVVLARNVGDPALADSFRRAARAKVLRNRGLGLNHAQM
jgi:hypothetical protein